SRGITLTTAYNMTADNQAYYRLNENGEATVTVRSKTPLKPRAVYVGEASMQCMWVSTGKSTSWQFTPTIIEPKQAKYTVEMDGQDQVITVELGKITPTSGLINSNVTGEIRASAIQFDLPYATDLWVFILKSPSEPLKITSDKAALNIAHTLAYVTEQIEARDDTLRSYVTMHGEGFFGVQVNLKRRTSRSSSEETLAEIKYGAAAITWKPIVRNFDVTLTTLSAMAQGDFLELLKTFGAEINKGVFSNLKSDFVLGDGPAIEYTLTLRGEKKYIGKEEDKTALKLNF
ncbi:MAG TPA: hypothetical protein VLH35_03910, partial [Candidatus Acidoferrales bacterium]|nr:hypothetical protein [Candidatus Acidoferrales bacterium]